jgi:hypothetical protein
MVVEGLSMGRSRLCILDSREEVILLALNS